MGERVKAVRLLGTFHAKVVEGNLCELRAAEAKKRNNELVYAIDDALGKLAD